MLMEPIIGCPVGTESSRHVAIPGVSGKDNLRIRMAISIFLIYIFIYFSIHPSIHTMKHTRRNNLEC